MKEIALRPVGSRDEEEREDKEVEQIGERAIGEGAIERGGRRGRGNYDRVRGEIGKKGVRLRERG